jgi:alkyl hydroperoxide reductase subunit F
LYDLIIIGGGPGGVAAGVYAARKKIKTLLITDGFGGQSLVSADVQNWIGTKSVSGFELAKMLEEHLRAQEGTDIVDDDLVAAIAKTSDCFDIKTRNGKSFQTKYILVAAGGSRKKLGIPGEQEFNGKGVAYCSTCDAPIFEGKTVAVVGGGNAGVEAVHDLLPYASKIYLLVRSDILRGDPVTQEKIEGSPKVEIIFGALPQEVFGGEFVQSIRYKDAKTGETKELKVEGVFVEIGSVPNSDLVKNLVNLNERGEIVVDHKTQATSLPGIWAVGDATDVLYKQNNISAGDAVKAALNIYEHIRKH